jgi:hypothetical protein
MNNDSLEAPGLIFKGFPTVLPSIGSFTRVRADYGLAAAVYKISRVFGPTCVGFSIISE